MSGKTVNAQNAVKYKWCAVLINCLAMLIAYTKACLTIPEKYVSELKIGSDFLGNFVDIGNYLSDDLNAVKDALLQGKLTLLQTYKGLSALGEFLSEEESVDGMYLVRIFYFLIVLFFIMEIVEILWYLLDKRISFWGSMISGTALVGMVFWGVVLVNQEVEKTVVKMSAWAWICLLLTFVSSFFWHLYRKYAPEDGTNSKEKMMHFIHELAEAKGGETNVEYVGNTENRWIFFFQKNKVIVLVSIIAAFLPDITEWLGLSYGSIGSLLSIAGILLEGVVIGLAIIYARAERYEYLLVYGILSVAGNSIFYKSSVHYFSTQQQLGYIWYPVMLAVALYLCERFLKKNKLYGMIAVTAVLRIIGVTWLQINVLSIGVDISTVVVIIGTAVTLYTYLYKRTLFKKLSRCTDYGIVENKMFCDKPKMMEGEK